MFILRPLSQPRSTCAVSVIIPMYNVEKYIAETLDNFLMQTFQDFEVIVVNDCSTDNSRAIAESYVPKFGGRMKVFDNEKNSGPSVTRNNGLRLATGEYVYFMDSDDLILLNALEKLYATAKEYDAEVVNSLGLYIMSEDGSKIIDVWDKRNRLLKDANEFLVDHVLSWIPEKTINYIFYAATGARLLRRDFLLKNKLFFPEDVKRGEDIVWRHGFALCAEKIVHVPFIFYFYRRSQGSLARKKRSHAEFINSRMTTVIDGIKWIDNVMNRVPFFEQNPQYRYKVLEDFTWNLFGRLLGYTQKHKCSPAGVYEAVKQEYSEKLGKYNVLVAELCSLINGQQKEIREMKEQLASK